MQAGIILLIGAQPPPRLSPAHLVGGGGGRVVHPWFCWISFFFFRSHSRWSGLFVQSYLTIFLLQYELGAYLWRKYREVDADVTAVMKGNLYNKLKYEVFFSRNVLCKVETSSPVILRSSRTWTASWRKCSHFCWYEGRILNESSCLLQE